MSDTTSVVSITITSAGAQTTSPQDLLDQLIAIVTADQPGYTADLPASLIDDVSGTCTAGVVLCNQFLVETLNSLNPAGANPFLLAQLGQIYGPVAGLATTTSVNVIFSGTPGFPIPVGFTVSDTVYQYTVQDAGIISESTGQSALMFCLATVAGSWAVPAGSVTQIVTSLPANVSLSVTNPLTGTPGTDAETEEAYRARVMQAGQAVSQGMTTMLKTALGNVSGVQQRLISVRQSGTNWEVIVGGGDPYQVANAIFLGLFDINHLVGSTLAVTNATQANPGVVTTNLNHGFPIGTTTPGITFSGVVGMTQLNTGTYTVTGIDEKTFSIGVNSTSFGAYVSGGVVLPNVRNTTIDIYDTPDTYAITYVQPPLQTVALTVTWNTTSTNIVSNAAVQQVAIPALVGYINSITVGQPINLFELQATFQAAVVDLVPTNLLTRMVFSVSINGVGTSPSSGTGIIAGDPESYFYTTSTQITVEQG